jgi:dienelactone hydrolase
MQRGRAASHSPTYPPDSLYPGNGHLFTDASLPDYDKAAADLVMQRVLEFLGRL